MVAQAFQLKGDALGKIVSRVSVVAGHRRMTISDIARKSELSYPTAADHWHGKATRIDFDTLAALCKALSCQPGDLLEYVDDGNNGGHS